MALHKLVLVAMVASFGLAGCDVDEGPAEETGESLDEAGDQLEDAADDTTAAALDACGQVTVTASTAEQMSFVSCWSTSA